LFLTTFNRKKQSLDTKDPKEYNQTRSKLIFASIKIDQRIHSIALQRVYDIRIKR